MRRRMLLLTAALVAIAGLMFSSNLARADGPDDDEHDHSAGPLTVAVFGDWPYSNALLAKAPALLSSVNGDPTVRTVIHVGDIHSGSMPCTGVGLNPTPAGSNPTWNAGIFNVFQQFADPVVYTPGDNEWTDCHKFKELQSGAPLNELASVRSMFFPHPGYTLGGRRMKVESQAQKYQRRYPTDAKFVENVMWMQSQVMFVTLNVPGSNNDGLPWNGAPTAPALPSSTFLDEAARQQEVAERNAANLRWLDRAFDEANDEHAKAIVIALQADMWDPAALVPGGDGLNGYDVFVRTLADLSVKFRRPVLLLNGDSHLFEVDQPLANPSSATGLIHGTQAVPNLTRITVQGSTNTPNEWLKLTIDPKSPSVFSWVNVPY